MLIDLLIVQDQHVLSLQSRLKAYLESTIGESSEEDYESNTSPQQVSCESNTSQQQEDYESRTSPQQVRYELAPAHGR